MSEFIQLHMLVSYPPSNLNRDDLGRPKTAVMGGKQRLRVSSQSLKRAWRQSEIFKDGLFDHVGIRTKEMGNSIEKALLSGKKLSDSLKKLETVSFEPVDVKKSKMWAISIAEKFGKCKKDSPEHEQMVHFSGDEIEAIDNLLIKISGSGEDPSKSDLNLLRKKHSSADIAMFGRMLAKDPGFNTEAAVQVSHAITVHDVAIEDDWFTAVDDLNSGEENAGSAHIGELEFASGLFYTYVCINRDLLVENLSDDSCLADKAIQSLVEAAAKVSPSGKQNSFASRAYASYILAEKGTQQPRSLSVAYLKAIKSDNLLESSIESLENTRDKFDKVYGKCAEARCEMNVFTGEGSLVDILEFVKR
ncbi:MAG: type I-E CRISPR-associated protein Cas7/Cse4/CasC [Methanomicrobiaceae archaeon]|nr:type I-E CRISPR-associated protein Cas7/Cse4/CasC [Methanomicrobiaceae archaeon]